VYIVIRHGVFARAASWQVTNSFPKGEIKKKKKEKKRKKKKFSFTPLALRIDP
jgi:hypothetical protein